jgi:hypothetical protein
VGNMTWPQIIFLRLRFQFYDFDTAPTAPYPWQLSALQQTKKTVKTNKIVSKLWFFSFDSLEFKLLLNVNRKRFILLQYSLCHFIFPHHMVAATSRIGSDTRKMLQFRLCNISFNAFNGELINTVILLARRLFLFN